MIKKTIFFFSFLLIGIVLFVLMIMQTGIKPILDSLSEFSLLHFIILLALSLLNFCLFNLRWAMILKDHHTQTKIPFYRLFLHRMSAYTISYLAPSAQTAGEPLRVYYLKDEGVNMKTAVSSVIIDKVFEYTAALIFIISGVVIAIFKGGVFSDKFELILAAIITVFGLLILWFYYSMFKRIGFFSSILRFFQLTRIKRVKKLEQKIILVENQMTEFYKSNIKKFFILLLLSFLMVAFIILEHWIIAKFMGVDLTFTQSYLAGSLPYIAYMLPIPGGIGLLEGSHAAIFTLMGVSINAVAFVFIIRLRDIVFILIGLAHTSRKGIHLIKENFQEVKP